MDRNGIMPPPVKNDDDYQTSLDQLDHFVDSLTVQEYGTNEHNENNNISPLGFEDHKAPPVLTVDTSDIGAWPEDPSLSVNELSETALSPQGYNGRDRSESVGGTSVHNYTYPSPQVYPAMSTSMNQRSSSISNQGRSYGSQFGTSFNNLISPSSTYDGFLDSPYGSYQGASFTDSYLKSPMNSPSFKAIGSPASVGSHMNPKNALSKEGKLNRRRELHNAVERRRRDLIKEKIKELGTLIPPSLLNNFTKSKNNPNKEIKANKSTILTESIDYIGYLKEISQSQDKKLNMLRQRIAELSSEPPSGQDVQQSHAPIADELKESFTVSDPALEAKDDFQDFKVEDPEAFFQELLKGPNNQSWMT
ncbi:hypothetical protein OGAPHI_005055 [Ogataea philodendri]|uniref:BHLH domain-containing protein n=1 Tax=Ogataea philodendri TaxID=1378263 RepID=A0A9P8P227_9ASCO|nr:uncharacterized protein OGAPHI_005055 [Ogataea philodendri]KAH3663654.1 hypothetical protein OGAPHI_005055 [Ogataea philodendri]